MQIFKAHYAFRQGGKPGRVNAAFLLLIADIHLNEDLLDSYPRVIFTQKALWR